MQEVFTTFIKAGKTVTILVREDETLEFEADIEGVRAPAKPTYRQGKWAWLIEGKEIVRKLGVSAREVFLAHDSAQRAHDARVEYRRERDKQAAEAFAEAYAADRNQVIEGRRTQTRVWADEPVMIDTVTFPHEFIKFVAIRYPHLVRYDRVRGQDVLVDAVVKELGEEFTLGQFLDWVEGKKAEKEGREAEVAQKARETGVPQILSQYTEPCALTYEECSLDLVTVYVLPSGERQVERKHTW